MVAIAIKMVKFKTKYGYGYYPMNKTTTEDGHISMVFIAIQMGSFEKKDG